MLTRQPVILLADGTRGIGEYHRRQCMTKFEVSPAACVLLNLEISGVGNFKLPAQVVDPENSSAVLLRTRALSQFSSVRSGFMAVVARLTRR